MGASHLSEKVAIDDESGAQDSFAYEAQKMVSPPPPSEIYIHEEKVKRFHVDINVSNSKDVKALHELPKRRKTTFFQTTVNCVSMLYGLGMLSSPFAVAKGGWTGALIGVAISTGYMYAAYLMSRCVEIATAKDCDDGEDNGTYEGVARIVCGPRMRTVIEAMFYIEITGTLVGYCISVGDNLSYLFPTLEHWGLPGLTGHNFMIFVASLVILPTVWLRDLSALSFTSIWCIFSTLGLLVAVVLAASINGIGVSHPIPLIRMSGVPVAAGLYAFSFGGTSVFPSIYSSMKDRSQFPKVLFVSFVVATTSISGLGILGAYMFGDETASQVTLSMPLKFITTKIVLWMTVVTPMFKFALQLSPITTALEACLYQRCKASKSILFGVSTLMRSMALAMIAIFSMVFPYFEYIVALVGSSMTIAICLIFPCIFYLKLYWNHLNVMKKIMIFIMVIIGTIIGVYGTIVSIGGLVHKTTN